MSESHSDDGPQLKKTKFENNLDVNRNSPHQLIVEVTGATSHEELSDHDKNSDNDKSVIMIRLEEKLLECERTIHLLTQELHKQKEKSIQDQTMFIKTLSDLQTFNSGKQHYLEATITGLQKELQTEKLRTSKQTQSIQTLTIANNSATNRADSLQRKLLDAETELNLGKKHSEKDQQDLVLELKEKDNQITELKLQLEAVSSSNFQLQQESDCIKADLLQTKSQLEQTLQDNHLLRNKYEPPIVELSDSDTEGTRDQRMPLLHVSHQFKENVKKVEYSCDVCCFHPILPVLAFTHNCDAQIVKFLTAKCVSTPFSEWKDSKEVFLIKKPEFRISPLKITVLTWNVSQVKGNKSRLVCLVDGTKIAAGTQNGCVSVWSYPSGKIIFETQHLSGLTGIEWNPFNPCALASRDSIHICDKQKIVLWDSSTIARQITLELNKICSVKWMAKNVIAIGLDNGTIRIYEIDQNQSTVRVIKEFKHDKAIGAMHSLNETFLASCSMDNSIKIWSMQSNQFVFDFSQLNCNCNCIAWRPIANPSNHLLTILPESSTVVGGLIDGSIIIWNPFRKNEIKMLKQHSSSVNSISFSPDGKLLASSDVINQVILWSTETWVPIFVESQLNRSKRQNMTVQFSWLLVKSTKEGNAYKLAYKTLGKEIHVIENV